MGDTQEKGGAETPAGAHAECPDCRAAGEPCSPDCFEKLGHPRDNFADFVGHLRRARAEKEEADRKADAIARHEKAEADATAAHELAEAANAKAAAKAAREASAPKPKRKAQPGHLLATVVHGAGKIGYGLYDYSEGETFDISPHHADTLVKAGLIRLAD